MGKVVVRLETLEVRKKQEVGRDEAYLWVFGILVETNTIQKWQFIVEKPCNDGNLGGDFSKGEYRAIPAATGRIERPVKLSPLFPSAMFGVLVIAWEHDSLSSERQTKGYQAVCTELQSFIAGKIKSGDIKAKEDMSEEELEAFKREMKSLKKDIEKVIKEKFTAGTSGIGRFMKAVVGGYDEHIGTDYLLQTLDQDKSDSWPISFTLTPNDRIDYRIKGAIKYTA